MKIESHPQALTLKNRVEGLSRRILEQDGQAADLDSAKDQVQITAGQGPAVIFPADHRYQEEILAARVAGDQGQVRSAQVDSKQYYDTSYGRSAESGYHLEKQVEGDTTIYRERYYCPFNTNNRKSEVRVNSQGEVLKFQQKEFASTWPEAFKQVFTSPAGLILVGAAGALGGAPGSLGYFLAGSSWPGLVTAGAAAVGLAYAKTRPW